MSLRASSNASQLRVGFSAAFLTLVVIGEAVALSCWPIGRRQLAMICLWMSVLGLLSWVAGQLNHSEIKPFNPPNGLLFKERLGPEHPLVFLKSLRYWGLILIISAAVAYLLPVLAAHARPIVVRAKQKEAVLFSNLKSTTRPATFPRLKLQALMFQGDRSSVVVNGELLRTGEMIGQVRVMAIERDRVTLALSGQTEVLLLGK